MTKERNIIDWENKKLLKSQPVSQNNTMILFLTHIYEQLYFCYMF